MTNIFSITLGLIAVATFLGLGGIQKVQKEIDKINNKTIQKDTTDTSNTPNTTVINNTQPDTIVQSTPNRDPIIINTEPSIPIPPPRTSPRNVDESPLTVQEQQDLIALQKRRSTSKTASRKRTAQQIILDKRTQAAIAAKNPVFQGTNNFANPNFNVTKSSGTRNRKRTASDFLAKGFSQKTVDNLVKRGVINP